MDGLVFVLSWFVGIVIFVVVIVPVASAILTTTVIFVAMGAAIAGSVLLYIAGIPLAVWHRWKYGYWA